MILIDLPSSCPSPTSLVFISFQMLLPEPSCPSHWKADQEHRAFIIHRDKEESHCQDCETARDWGTGEWVERVRESE